MNKNPTTIIQAEIDALPSDLEEKCRQITGLSDDSLRQLSRQLAGDLKKKTETEVLGWMLSTLIDEILRLRRELRKTL